MVLDNPTCKSLFVLARLGVGHDAHVEAEIIDWAQIKVLAEEQGLSAIVLDGIGRLRAQNSRFTDGLEKRFLTQWIGEVLRCYECRYEQYRSALLNLVAFYNEHKFKVMVLKGFACGLDWPKPDHRPYGDIDIWLFGQQRQADMTIQQDKGVKIDNSHHHHSVFYWHDFMVENHYDFINIKDLRSSKGLETVFKELGTDDSHFIELNGEKIYFPSPNLHALFLVRHLVAHFASVRITVRQVLDWAFFVEKHTKEVDWKWLEGVLEKYHMMDFFNLINEICIEDLGFEASIFPFVNFRPDLKDKVLNDILYPKFSASEPSCLIPRLVYKYRRWQGNAWKQELCYSESRWSAFWSGIWGHLLKPASI